MPSVRTLLLALTVAVATTRAAHAGGDVGVVVTGEGTMQPQLAAQIEGWLAAHGHTLVASPLPPDAITALVDCFVLEDQRCARGVVEKRARTSTVVYARVDAKTTAAGRDVTLTAYWFDKGHAAVAERRTCEHCTDVSLRTTADDIMKKLAGTDVGELGHVAFRSAPPGARITIDGQAVGVTPLDWDLAAGKHSVLLDKTGLRPESRDITVVGGKSDKVDVALAVDDRDKPHPSKIVPLVVMVAGGALIATGGVMIAIHQEPGLDQPYMVRNTRPAGIGLAIGGAAVLGAGIYLYFFRHPQEAGPVAAVTSDSGYVGWLGEILTMPRVIHALGLVLVLASCKEVNPDFCKNAANAGDPHCKVDAGMKCSSRDMCTEPGQPVCDLMDNGGTCVACTSSDPGACAGMTPICSAAQTCEACATDVQCSGVCLPGGACAAQGDIIWVSTTGDMGTGSSAGAPCNFARGLMLAAGGPTRHIISMASGTYMLGGPMGQVVDGTVVIDARNAVNLERMGSDGPVLTIHPAANVTLLGGHVTGADKNNGDAIIAQAGSTVAVIDTTIDQNDHSAINCDACALSVIHATITDNSKMDVAHPAILTNTNSTLQVSRSTFTHNHGGAISATNTRFVIANNFIYNNGDASSTVGGISISSSPATGNQLDFNSVVRNTAQSGPGIKCDAGTGFKANNNIIWNNNLGSGAQVANSCLYAYSVVGPVAVTSTNDGGNDTSVDPRVLDEIGNLHLNSDSPVKDMADPTTTLTGIMATDFDGDARPLPTGERADIGADEVP